MTAPAQRLDGDGPRPFAVELVSVIVPVFDEVATIAELVRRVRSSPVRCEVIVVDDGSSDGTAAVVTALARDGLIRLVTHPVNRGKGAAVRSGLALARGDVVIIQDADLEYDPADFPALLAPIEEGRAQVVYGWRSLGRHRGMSPWHAAGNRLLTRACNLLFRTALHDMETGYKVMRADVARSLSLRSARWGFDPEVTAKLLRAGWRIHGVPISYAGREVHEGKKIRCKDGFVVLLTLIRYRFTG